MADISTALAQAVAFHRAGQWQRAEEIYRQILAADPQQIDALHLFGVLACQVGQLEIAADYIGRAIALNAQVAEFHCNLGLVFRRQGNLDEATTSYRRALELTPNYPGAHNNLGMALLRQGKLDEARVCFRRALEFKPDYAEAHSNLLFSLTHNPAIEPRELLAEHRRWASQHAAAPDARPHLNDRQIDRRLRVGYVSGDFRNHPVSRFVEPILRHHDPAAYEVFGYSHLQTPDAVTANLRSLAHQWREIASLSDAQLVELVRADQIDILVDLSGHTAGNRLLALARKPAPVQVTYLGYPGTTGLPAIDYRLTDAELDPPGEEVSCTERLVRLSRGVCCYALPDSAPDVAPLPAASAGRIMFGSLHRLSKLNAGVLDLWAGVLKAVPDSRLLMFRDTLRGATSEMIRREFAARGIVADRLELRHAVGPLGHLAVFHEIDIGLDTFPYNGGTISYESLWMGVPLVTLRGQRTPARGGASLLHSVGLDHWIADTPDEYVARAVRWASNLEGLSELRADLRRRMRESVGDCVAFTRELEAAYRQMWHAWVDRIHSS